MFNLIQKKEAKENGFTALEMIMVVAVIVLLMGAILVIINPIKRIQQAQDVERGQDIEKIMSKIANYTTDNKGTTIHCDNLGTTIPPDNIWRAIATSDPGSSYCDLSTDLAKYLSELPEDPVTGDLENTGDTGYEIMRDTNGIIYINAPDKSSYVTAITIDSR